MISASGTARTEDAVPVTIDANFSEDLRAHFTAELTKLGVTLPHGKVDVESAGVAYFNVTRRLISARPRKVSKSKELSERALTIEQQGRLDTIIHEFEAGSDLRPRLSKGVFDRPLYNDPQQNDWDIRHLHVGPISDPHGPELLFVCVTDDCAYLVEWGAHGVQSFADQRMLEILHTNWPEVVAHMKAPGVVPGSLDPADLTPEQRDPLRRKFTIATQVSDGTVYLPAGGGVMLDGTSSDVARRVDDERQLAHDVEQWARENAVALRDGIERASGVRLEALRLRYMVGRPVRVQELQTKLVLVPPEEQRGADL